MKEKNILIIGDMISGGFQDMLKGVTQKVDATGGVGIRLTGSGGDLTAAFVRQMLREGIAGVIAWNTCPDAAMDVLLRSKLPLVLLDPSDRTLAKAPGRNCYTVTCDDAAVSRRAASILLGQRRFHSYAYVGERSAPNWSVARGRAFAGQLATDGIACRSYEPFDLAFDRRNLARFLRTLSTPAAVFAANDQRAVEVLDICASLKLKVPDQISVLGVDNDVLVCQHVSPTLSSIEPDFFRSGDLAARILIAVFAGHPPPSKSFSYGIRDISLRTSTTPQTSSAKMVERALAFIRSRAGTGIGAEGVAKKMGVSRQLLNIRFRENNRGSVLAEITAVRIEEAKRLLTTTNDKIASITRAVGYESEKHFKAVFRRATGFTMTAWRQRQG